MDPITSSDSGDGDPDTAFSQHVIDCSNSLGLYNLPSFLPFPAHEFYPSTLPSENQQIFSFDPHEGVPSGDVMSSVFGRFNPVEDFRPCPPTTPSLEALQATLSDIQHKIQQLQMVVQSMVHANTQPQQDITGQITSIMFQLMSTTAGLMQQTAVPPVQSVSLLNDVPREATNPNGKDFVEHFLANAIRETQNFNSMPSEIHRSNNLINPLDIRTSHGGVSQAPLHQGIPLEDDVSRHPSKDDEDAEIEELPPDSYDIVELNATEILAEHTHFCEICGKGFKRDANLRMHMRSHGDEYKTSAALAKPSESYITSSIVRLQRYSCPYLGCRRNRKHDKFLPLKTLLCVKNHYRRSHCPKTFACNKCKAKKFSVLADLKTHEKHCGCSKWQCSCGTTFSRKDKLYGHIGLFPGHTPVAMAINEEESSEGPESDELGSQCAPDWGELPSHGSMP